jgi:hypothetical protein
VQDMRRFLRRGDDAAAPLFAGARGTESAAALPAPVMATRGIGWERSRCEGGLGDGAPLSIISKSGFPVFEMMRKQ